MSREAMKLALEALEQYTNVVASVNNPDAWVTVVDAGKPAREAITALREALAEQPAQQEPFGYFRYDLRLDAWVQNRAGLTGTPFYTSPPAQPDFWEGYVPEPVGAVGSFIKSESPLGCNGPTGPAQQDSTCNNTLRAQGKAYTRTCKKCGKGPCVELAQQALDKKAENARELGLDYEPAHQEPVALFKWLPEGATHIGRISVRTSSGGSLAMTTHAFKYDNAVLKVYVTDNDNEYPGWRDAKDCFFHLNFPVLPLYTSPPAQRTWVGLMRGVRVEGDTVVITVKGGNDEARCLCGELISEMEKKT